MIAYPCSGPGSSTPSSSASRWPLSCSAHMRSDSTYTDSTGSRPQDTSRTLAISCNSAAPSDERRTGERPITAGKQCARRPDQRTACKDCKRVDLAPKTQRQSRQRNETVQRARVRSAGHPAGTDHEQRHDSRPGPAAERVQPGMLDQAAEELRRGGSEEPRHKEHADRRRAPHPRSPRRDSR